jgi:hypothetical protein
LFASTDAARVGRSSAIQYCRLSFPKPFAFVARGRTASAEAKRGALGRDAPSFADQLLEFGARCELGRGRAGVVIDLLFGDGAVDVVGAESTIRYEHENSFINSVLCA